MPLTGRQVLTAKLAAGMAVALPALVLVCATGAAVKDVRLSVAQWAAIVGCIWLGSLPFSLMGVAIGYAVGSETAFPLSYALYMAMSAVGGLWVPPSELSSSFLHVADVLPTYRLADLGWRIAGGHAPTAADVAVLAAWTVGFAALAVLVYRGPLHLHRARHTTKQAQTTHSATDSSHSVRTGA